MKLYIKNMVCNRCKMVVQATLEKHQIHPISVMLGEVTLNKSLTDTEIKSITQNLQTLGFVILNNKKSQIIEQIKTIIITLIHHNSTEWKGTLSSLLSNQLHLGYNYLSNLFSESESTTIEKYFITQKIEKVKGLLVYNELILTEIAFQFQYSSVAHLSNQFKKVTRLTPRHFKKIQIEKRKPLDEMVDLVNLFINHIINNNIIITTFVV